MFGPGLFIRGSAKYVKAEKPANVNWDLWLGPAPERHYCADIHPFKCAVLGLWPWIAG